LGSYVTNGVVVSVFAILGFALFCRDFYKRKNRGKGQRTVSRIQIDRIDAKLIWPARITVLCFFCVYAFTVYFSYVSSPLPALFAETHRRADEIHALTLYDPKKIETIDSLIKLGETYEKLANCTTRECWEDSLSYFMPFIDMLLTAHKAVADRDDNTTNARQLYEHLYAYKVALRSQIWNDSNPANENKEAILQFVFASLPQKTLDKLPENLRSANLKNYLEIAMFAKQMAENMDEIRRQIGMQKSGLDDIAQLLGIDDFHVRTKRYFMNAGLGNTASTIAIGMFGEFPSSMYALTNALAADYAAKKYSQIVTKNEFGFSTFGETELTNMTITRFAIETAFTGVPYFVHIMKTWLQAFVLEFTFIPYGVLMYVLSHYCHTYQEAGEMESQSYYVIRFIYLLPKACKYWLFWFAAVITIPIILGLASSFVTELLLRLLPYGASLKLASTGLGIFAKKSVKDFGEFLVEYLVSLPGLLVGLQSAFYVAAIYVKTRFSKWRTVALRSKEFLTKKTYTEKTPQLSFAEAQFKKWETIKTAFCVVKAASPIIFAVIQYLPNLHPIFGVLKIVDLGKIGDMNAAEYGINYFWAHSDVYSIPSWIIGKISTR
jgi:hypothetical protein